MSRLVVTDTGLERYIGSDGELGCDVLELPSLRVALQRTIDELDGYLEGDMLGWLSKQTTQALAEYYATKEGPPS